MEQQGKKYFVPKPEEVFWSYEYESLTSVWDENGKKNYNWLPEKAEGGDGGIYDSIEDYLVEGGNYRVPFLDKEQIEELGWKCVAIYDKEKVHNNKFPTTEQYEYGNVWKDKIAGFLTHVPEKHEIKITTVDEGVNRDGPNNSVKYKGECKDKNTLRYIMKLLKIQ